MDSVFTSGDFQNILADVTVTHPFPADIGAFTPPMISPLHFAKSAESRKKTRYSQAARQINHNFIPFAFETFGASGPSFDFFLKNPSKQDINASFLGIRALILLINLHY